MFKKLILVALLTLAPLPVFAQNRIAEISVVRSENKPDTEDLPLAKDIRLRQRRVFQELDRRDTYTFFSIELLSSFKTRIKIKYTDENITLRHEKEDTILLPENKSRNITFYAFNPTKGYLIITDEEDNPIMEIPYIVKERSNVNQSVGFSTSASTGNFDPSVTVRYHRGVRADYSDQASWSFNTSVSTSLDDLDNIRFQLGVNYSW